MTNSLLLHSSLLLPCQEYHLPIHMCIHPLAIHFQYQSIYFTSYIFQKMCQTKTQNSITVLYHFSWASYEAFQYVVRRWRQLFQTMKDFSKTVLWSARFLSMKTSIIDCLKCFCSIKYAASWAPISTWLKNWLPILLTCCRITNFATFWKFFFPSIFFLIM